MTSSQSKHSLATVKLSDITDIAQTIGYQSIVWLSVIYLIQIDNYDLLPQRGGKKKFSYRPLEGQFTFYSAPNFKALNPLSLWCSIILNNEIYTCW
jgi:hypothetical protein